MRVEDNRLVQSKQRCRNAWEGTERAARGSWDKHHQLKHKASSAHLKRPDACIDAHVHDLCFALCHAYVHKAVSHPQEAHHSRHIGLEVAMQRLQRPSLGVCLEAYEKGEGVFVP